MATKEEILFKISGVKNIHKTVYNATEVEMAMDEYVKQECAAKDAEIKRLKGLIEKAHDSGYNSYEKYSIGLSWLGFKTDNDL